MKSNKSVCSAATKLVLNNYKKTISYEYRGSNIMKYPNDSSAECRAISSTKNFFADFVSTLTKFFAVCGKNTPWIFFISASDKNDHLSVGYLPLNRV